ncbi:hypothetical protein O988_01564 [Pseudogymnoascus sp. VKM F-3808]|nr:hypothetical protein O988_01564 [Pseudogymnoascus sp. VKM F-3808]
MFGEYFRNDKIRDRNIHNVSCTASSRSTIEPTKKHTRIEKATVLTELGLVFPIRSLQLEKPLGLQRFAEVARTSGLPESYNGYLVEAVCWESYAFAGSDSSKIPVIDRPR